MTGIVRTMGGPLGRRMVPAGLALTLLAGGPMLAQQQEGARIVTATMDFLVVTREGQPVTDVRADEVVLRVNGRPRPIKSVQFVPFSGAAAARPAGALEPAFATNTGADVPRSIVVVVDDESIPIGQERALRESINQFINQLKPSDRVALVTIPRGGIKADLGTDRERLRQAVASIMPISPIDEPSCRTRTALATLQTTLGRLDRSSDQPVIVALLSSAMVGASQVEMMQRPTVTGGGVSAAAGSCYLTNDDFTKTGQIVAENGVQLYVIHPNFSAGPVGDGIENLRGVTGAPLLHLQSNTEPGLQRILRETSGYYVATFETEPGERLGVAHTAELRVSRQGVEVRSRPWVVLGRATAATTGADAAPAVTTPMDMLRTARSYRDLPIRASAFSAANEGGVNVNVIGLFEPTDPTTKIMTAAATLYDETGTPKAYWAAEERMFSAWPVAMVMTVPPGTYRMRVAAIDSNGRLGTVDDEIVAELKPAGPVQVSGLVLGLSREGRFTPRLQFTKEATALAYVEIYGATPGMPLGIYFELITADGKSSFTTRGIVEASADEKKFMATATIPIGALPPGDYVVRATVGVKDQPAGQVVRTLHKAR